MPLGHTIREDDIDLKKAPLPDRLLPAWDAAFPVLQVQDSLLRPSRFREKAERMVFAPLFPASDRQHQETRGCRLAKGCLPFLLQAILTQSHYVTVEGVVEVPWA